MHITKIIPAEMTRNKTGNPMTHYPANSTFLRFFPALALLFAFGFVADTASAQVLKKRLLENQKADTAKRRPNDQIEGTIWEYKSTKYKSKLEKGQEAPKISGKFRIEGNAVFAVEKTVKVKSRDDRRSRLKKIAQGEGGEVSVPSGAEPKRIGEYKRTDDGKIKFTFDDPNSLHGTMIVQLQKDSRSVWQGNYYQKEGKKTTGKWLVELRAVED